MTVGVPSMHARPRARHVIMPTVTPIEELAWDVKRARQRTDAERAEVARYIADLMEPLVGMRLLVGVEPDCDEDVIYGPVLVPARDDSDRVWTGIILGNAVGAPPDEEVMYSIILFPFVDGRRAEPDSLRSFSARLGSSGPEVYASGSIDEYGEWDIIETPLDCRDFTVTPQLVDAARALGLMRKDD